MTENTDNLCQPKIRGLLLMIWLGRGDEKRSVLTWKHGYDYCLIGAISARKSADIDYCNVS
nr:MAG TPA: hypothetical protein [Caudoviricetes sp.]